jgi:hypothetical protein
MKQIYFIRETGLKMRKIQIIEELVKDVIFRDEVPPDSSLVRKG